MLDFEKSLYEIKEKINSLKESQEKMTSTYKMKLTC